MQTSGRGSAAAAATAAARAPPPAQPTVTLASASRQPLQTGQSSTLTWSSTNATSLNLAPGIGTVAPQGSTTVTPTDSITYTITATGPGGSANASARVTVTRATAAAAGRSAALAGRAVHAGSAGRLLRSRQGRHPRRRARRALSKTAQFLRSYPQVKVTVEGHCDERGSTEYNLALGDRRAQAAKDFLVSLGVAADRMQTVSYGKERPFCTDHDEDVLAAESPRALRYGQVTDSRGIPAGGARR